MAIRSKTARKFHHFSDLDAAVTLDAFVTLCDERETILTPEDLLRQMDHVGVQKAVVHPGDRALAVDYAEGNRLMLEAARMHPTRLIATCTANPWFGSAAIRGIRKAIDRGARMVTFAPSLQGFILGDEVLHPILDSIAELRIPVYVHTGPHLHSTPWQLVNVAERYPSLPFVMGHSGATDFWTDVPQATLQASNIYLETSFARPFAMQNHLKTVGIDRGIMGSGAPRNRLKFEWDQMRMVFPENKNPGLFGRTLEKLFREVQV